eukprot:CAMPEP_0115590090 /NCGR_PEP_ID=MMETSP0272-20121206/9585_1 /TAXON_ID=71861 /ORGANISM="Scrippsiella trochoidea, Strain CCMP3099" /LENGTH=225 /DNA_ID=CAMNT_0003025275 /DNA_START=21 /DNA_END=694 /DNA_ORIENTATION=-
MSYYSGSRRFALGGKGWTIVLGTTVSLSYVRARAKWQDEDNAQAYQRLENRHGEEVKFADQPKDMAGVKEDIVLRVWRQLPEIPLPNLYAVGGVLTCLWAYRMFGTFNRLMTVRFGDINYQLRRPDVLANKVVALKYLALPLAIVPVGAVLCCGCSVAMTPEGEDARALAPLRRQAIALREALAGPCREASFLARDAVGPLAEELEVGPLANFARRSQTVGREVG